MKSIKIVSWPLFIVFACLIQCSQDQSPHWASLSQLFYASYIFFSHRDTRCVYSRSLIQGKCLPHFPISAPWNSVLPPNSGSVTISWWKSLLKPLLKFLPFLEHSFYVSVNSSYQLYFVLLYICWLKAGTSFGDLFIFVFLKISWSTWQMNTCLLFRECFTHISWKDFYRSTEFEFGFSFLSCQKILKL